MTSTVVAIVSLAFYIVIAAGKVFRQRQQGAGLAAWRDVCLQRIPFFFFLSLCVWLLFVVGVGGVGGVGGEGNDPCVGLLAQLVLASPSAHFHIRFSFAALWLLTADDYAMLVQEASV